MIGIPAGTQIWIVAGVTDMRRGFVGLSGLVQTALEQNPFSGHVFVFRGRRGDLVLRPVRCIAATAHDGHNSLAMLVRRKGEPWLSC
jgi:transposase